MIDLAQDSLQERYFQTREGAKRAHYCHFTKPLLFSLFLFLPSWSQLVPVGANKADPEGKDGSNEDAKKATRVLCYWICSTT